MANTEISNVLAMRYASEEVREVWGERQKVIMERELWLAVLRAQKDLGVDVPDGVIEAYEAVIDRVDLESIATRERRTRHDVKARIEEFCALAGYEHLHKGMTSRDLTDNVEQMQVLRSLELIRIRVVAALARLGESATNYVGEVIAGRSHFVPAQPTTVGKRIATIGEELLHFLDKLEHIIAHYQLRGIKGPVGTQQDQLDLLSNPDDVVVLERRIAEHLGFAESMNSVGQVYPRSYDSEVVELLLLLAAPAGNFAQMIRLMSGLGLASEGFKPGQTGSSAMPHKENSRSCERIRALQCTLRGHVTMANELAGDTWFEGDVSCSVIRRVVLPDSFFAIDGLYQTWLTVLDEFGFFPRMIQTELREQLPYLGTTKLLMAAVRAGMGREKAHEVIKEHALALKMAQREVGGLPNDLLERIAADPNMQGVELADLREALANPIDMTGAAVAQVGNFVRSIEPVMAKYPEAARYSPGEIL